MTDQTIAELNAASALINHGAKQMTFTEAKATAAVLEAEVTRLSAIGNKFPRNSIGLTPDHVKATEAFRQYRADYAVAFNRLRTFNATFVKTFAKELRAERRARRA